MYFENCKLPKENRIGDEGQGFSIAMNALGGGRIGIAAQAVGLARTALEKAISYSKERKQFGRPISSFGAIQNKLADIATNVQSARLLVWQAALSWTTISLIDVVRVFMPGLLITTSIGTLTFVYKLFIFSLILYS